MVVLGAGDLKSLVYSPLTLNSHANGYVTARFDCGVGTVWFEVPAGFISVMRVIVIFPRVFMLSSGRRPLSGYEFVGFG